ncbi:MAG: 30S ribosomal protein S20 [SAR202 cluster bacterium]|nr:30S ribosomal protein S20 [SAR202 cluster bacterium]
MPAPNKPHRQSLRRKARNRPIIAESRRVVARARRALTDGPKSEESAHAVDAAVQMLAKAAKKGVIHKKNASRRISRLRKAQNKVTA